MICAWSSHGLFLARRFEPARRGLRPCGAHAQIITVLAQFVASYRTRAFLISPRHAARAQPLTRASGRPGDGSTISMRSRLHLELILHLEAYGDRSQGCATCDTGNRLSMYAFGRTEGSPEMHIEPPIARNRSGRPKCGGEGVRPYIEFLWRFFTYTQSVPYRLRYLSASEKSHFQVVWIATRLTLHVCTRSRDSRSGNVVDNKVYGELSRDS